MGNANVGNKSRCGDMKLEEYFTLSWCSNTKGWTKKEKVQHRVSALRCKGEDKGRLTFASCARGYQSITLFVAGWYIVSTNLNKATYKLKCSQL